MTCLTKYFPRTVGFTAACREMVYSPGHVRMCLKGLRGDCGTTLATVAYMHPELLSMDWVPAEVRAEAEKAKAGLSNREALACKDARSAAARRHYFALKEQIFGRK